MLRAFLFTGLIGFAPAALADQYQEADALYHSVLSEAAAENYVTSVDCAARFIATSAHNPHIVTAFLTHGVESQRRFDGARTLQIAFAEAADKAVVIKDALAEHHVFTANGTQQTIRAQQLVCLNALVPE